MFPTKVTLRPEITKNKKKRITFISDEATIHLKEWLEQRDSYLKTACKRTKIKAYHGLITKNSNDPRIFSFSVDTARDIWFRLIKKSGFTERDERTGWYKVRIHGLRKFFRTYFARSESPNGRDIAEILMGHTGYLNESYLRYTEEQLKEEYEKAVKHLTIYDRYPENLQEEIEKQVENRIKGLEQEIYENIRKNLKDMGILQPLYFTTNKLDSKQSKDTHS